MYGCGKGGIATLQEGLRQGDKQEFRSGNGAIREKL